MFNKPWTDNEINLLKIGEIPPRRTISSARCKAYELGIPFHPIKKDLEPIQKEVAPAKIDNTWSKYEIAMLHKKKVPPGRTRLAAYVKAHFLGIPFNPIRKQKVSQKERIAQLREQIINELVATHKIRATARKFNVHYTAVRNIALELGILSTKENEKQ